MRLYASSSKQFIRETTLNQIAGKLKEAFFYSFRFNPSAQEVNSWPRIPLVLHGGTGTPKEMVLAAVGRGVAKVNVATALRQPYERLVAAGSVPRA
jgi:fructose/tagatose bisphosphate aldolase